MGCGPFTADNPAEDADPAALPPAPEPEDDRLREECGVFGIFGHDDAATLTMSLLDTRSIDVGASSTGDVRHASETLPSEAYAFVATCRAACLTPRSRVTAFEYRSRPKSALATTGLAADSCSIRRYERQ